MLSPSRRFKETVCGTTYSKQKQNDCIALQHDISTFGRLALALVPTLVERPSPIQFSVPATSSAKWLLALVSQVEPAAVFRMPSKVRAQARSAGGAVAVKTAVEEPLREQNDIARPGEDRDVRGTNESAHMGISQCTHRGRD